MKAFSTFLAFSALSLAAMFVGTLSGYLPEPRLLTWWLLMVTLLALGTKFVVADLLSSDGFRLSKASTDMSLTFLAAMTSLAIVQSVTHEAILDGPPLLLIAGDPRVPASRWEAEVAAWALSGLALLLFALCLLSAKWARGITPINARGVAKLIVSKIVCATLGCLSYASYLVMIFFKD